MLNPFERIISKRNPKVTPGNYNAIIWVPNRKKMIRRFIKDRFIPITSFGREYRDRFVHMLTINQGRFEPIFQPSQIEPDESPLDCFIALNCEEEIDITYGITPSAWNRIKLGIFIAFSFAELFVLFLIATNAMGSGI